jgi:hypothetical protein
MSFIHITDRFPFCIRGEDYKRWTRNVKPLGPYELFAYSSDGSTYVQTSEGWVLLQNPDCTLADRKIFYHDRLLALQGIRNN